MNFDRNPEMYFGLSINVCHHDSEWSIPLYRYEHVDGMDARNRLKTEL